MDNEVVPRRIGLALSGGGIRAAVFHLGVLRHLAEERLLEQVTQISTVSGGSLIIGAVFSHADLRWPASEQFLDVIYPRCDLGSPKEISFRSALSGGEAYSARTIGFSSAGARSCRGSLNSAGVSRLGEGPAG